MIEQLLYLLRYELYYKKRDVYDEAKIKKLTEKEVFLEIQTALLRKKPLCIGKLGGSESFAVSSVYFKRKRREAYEQLCRWSGFFPKEYDLQALKSYYKEQTMAINALDVVINFPKKYELFLLKKYADSSLKWCQMLTPWMQKEYIWTLLLENKNVLVIHPFAEMIQKQYKIREKIFKDCNMLPAFNLYVIKAVQTIADNVDDRFTTWEEALDYMTKEAAKIDFDIALIGCGAYGLPLAARIKNMGKIGIHCGGELQTYFGIRGRRWDEGFPNEMSKICNQYWVYPNEQEKVKGAEKIENGCYW